MNIRQHEKHAPFGRALVAVILLVSLPVEAGIGIMTRFGDVVLEGIQPGVYNLRQLRNMPYVVTNPGTEPVEVQVEVLIPRKTVEGYETIPDPGWVEVIPSRFRLEPQQNHFSDVVVRIPSEAEYQGRHFQATIWAHTVNTGLTGAGVNSRIRFSIGTMGPEALQKAKQAGQMMTVDFDLKPSSLYLLKVPTGKKVNTKSFNGSSLKLSNRADSKLTVSLKSVEWDKQFSLPPGYEPTPNPEWLAVKPETKTIKPLTIKPFIPVIRIPDAPQYKGKKFAFLIKAEVVASEAMPVEVYTRIYVNVAE